MLAAVAGLLVLLAAPQVTRGHEAVQGTGSAPGIPYADAVTQRQTR